MGRSHSSASFSDQETQLRTDHLSSASASSQRLKPSGQVWVRANHKHLRCDGFLAPESHLGPGLLTLQPHLGPLAEASPSCSVPTSAEASGTGLWFGTHSSLLPFPKVPWCSFRPTNSLLLTPGSWVHCPLPLSQGSRGLGGR